MSLRISSLLTLLLSPLANGCSAAVRPDGGRGLLPAGTPASDLSAPDQEGRVHRLRDDRGQVVVVCFYPKDATPGRTRAARFATTVSGASSRGWSCTPGGRRPLRSNRL
jgi:hypothetical protein